MYLLPQERIHQDRIEVVMMKQQIAELQAQVKKLESQVEVLTYLVRSLEADRVTPKMLQDNRIDTRDSLDRVADLLNVPRSRI